MLSYNPQRERADHLAQLTCGQSRITLIEQLIRDFELEIDEELHQHHLIVGPKGSGKTHLLRVVIASHVANHARLREAFQPIVLPEELAVRTPADLLLRILECLANNLEAVAKGRGVSVSIPAAESSTEQLAAARAACLEAIGAARSMQKPLDRLRRGHRGLVRASEALDKVLLPVVENLHDLFYLGASAGRRKRQETHWALRSLLQESKHIMLLSSATSLFGAVTQADAAFYDFFRTHRLQELHNDEVLQVIHRRLKDEDEHPSSDAKRRRRVRLLLEHFHERKGQLRGLLAITGGLPRYAHLIYDVIVDVNVSDVQSVLNSFLDDMTPYFAQRLDPRLLPEPEIDLLQSLASAWGPLQPSELAERLYGVLPNEVSVLLKRLEDRGLVTRKGRPDGRAITWDLTEPLYRVWTHFRTDSDEHRQFLLLAEFVARLFTMDELLGDRAHLLESCEAHPANAPVRQKLEADLRFIETAIEQQQAWRSGRAKPLLAAASETETTEETAPQKQAEGLFDALNEAKIEDNLALRDSLLDELRSLAGQWPSDEEVREQLAMGLFNTLNDAKLEGDLSRRDTLLDELRALAAHWPADEKVRKLLAKGLYNTLSYAKQEENLSRRDRLLDELRALAAQWPADEEVRKGLAWGLYNTLNYAKQEEDLSRRDCLLDELRALAAQWPADKEVRKGLAKGLFNTLIDARLEEDLSRRDRLLDELRALAAAWPLDLMVKDAMCRGLQIMIPAAGSDVPAEDSEPLVTELVKQIRSWPNDDADRLIEFGVWVLRQGGAEGVKRALGAVAVETVGGLGEQLRPVMLAAEVLEVGEERALAREPEEMRRVVRLVLEKAGHESAQAE